ncbi:siderophore-interacting protein [Acidimangrovimonas sediminis]|uniref:siderophore-interacting protein n=1 Tax=Acidimangrovimonas sediminis TaxID=2056283 RepID=UPI000C80C1EB|nr:siderophore-interacting protein [Acidimangrovimonas sediminis]
MTSQAPLPTIDRIRHDLVRRSLTVTAREQISPAMLRLTFGGEALAGFASAAFDDHFKLIVPDGAGGEARRDYTPRAFDPGTNRLTVDFALHGGAEGAGPATRWAQAAQVGDPVEIGGPRGSQRIGGPIAEWLLIGDETALPAIGRFAEEAADADMRASIRTLVAVPEAVDEQPLPGVAARWLHRADPTDPSPLIAALAEERLAPATFVWIAAEGGVARALRRHLVEDRGHPLQWLKASGYWIRGEADASVKSIAD